jgi:glycosyltransferase involved in cell wall biosynthesis
MTDPSISLIIPLFNKSSTVKRALESALRQAPPYNEIIVVDDASTDGSALIVQELIDQGFSINLVRHGVNKGPGAARNTGMTYASSDYIQFLDADDYLAANVTVLLRSALRKTSNSGLIAFQIQETELGITRPQRPSAKVATDIERCLSQVDDWISAHIAEPMFCSGSNVMISREIATTKVFDEVARSFEDWDFYFHICRIANERGRSILFIEKIGGYYTNDDGDSLSRRKQLSLPGRSPPRLVHEPSHDVRLRSLVSGLWICHALPRATFSQKLEIIRNVWSLDAELRPRRQHLARALIGASIGLRGYSFLATVIKRLKYA